MRKWIFLLIVSVTTFNSRAQEINADLLEKYKSIAKQITRTALEERKGYLMLRELATFGSRLNGSEGYYNAVNWVKETLSGFDLDTVWLQECSIPHWVRGNTEELTIITNNDLKRNMDIAALGGSVGTENKTITAEVIEIKSFDELEQKNTMVKNKIVFYNAPFDNGELNTFRAYSKAVKYRVFGVSRAAKYGARAVLVRSVGAGNDNVPHTGTLRYDESSAKIPAVAISTKSSDYLSNLLQLNDNVKLELNLSCKNLPDTTGYNVIAEIRGSEFPNEIIVIGGHFDSWDKGIGMHDDGAPSLQTVEALYLFKRLGIKPKRTIRCVLFANEESGGSGAKKYSEFAESDSANYHLAAIESDRGAFTPRGFSVTADSAIIDKMQNWLPVLNECLIDWIRPGGSGADVGRIKGTKALLGYVPDTQRYMDLHHSSNDVFEAVHPREMELGSAAIAVMALLLSDFGL